MANEALVLSIKEIIGLAKGGDIDASYKAYQKLFEDPAFAGYRPEDQRQALKLMVHAKNAPPASKRTPAMIEAHRSAAVPLTKLVADLNEPADHEMLGMCQVILGDDAASASFRAGLNLERERNPQSDLCGSLMKRISFL